jgi:hypothetical protein
MKKLVCLIFLTTACGDSLKGPKGEPGEPLVQARAPAA